MTQPNPDARIHCDICNKRSPYNDPREPWECFGEYNPKPTWRCETCIKAVKDATEQKQYLTCLSKEAYSSLRHANKVLLNRIKETIGLRPYQCPYCNKWHLTKKPLQ